ncbi:MAG: gamma-glutamylcyclotransferase [Angustibacter sp.]
MALYAAYACNLDSARMLARAPHSPLRGTGWIQGWRLTFAGEDLSWQGALCTIVEDPAAQVYVALYDVADADELTLNTWEGTDLGVYRKIHVRVHTLAEDLTAWVQVVDGYEGGLPSAAYLGEIAGAAEAAGAPADYVTQLRARPCRSRDESGGGDPTA